MSKKPTGNEIAKQHKANVKEMLMRPQFKDAVSNCLKKMGADSDRFVQIALTTVLANEKLLMCSESSIVQCLIRIAQINLIPGMTQQQAHLIPYKGEATLQIGYRGYITLAYRSERVQTIFPPQVVYAGDEFDYQHGTSAFLLHKPSRDADRSDDEVTDAYCMIKLRGDDEKIFHVMPRKELDKARAVSKADNDQAPWRLWFSEMCRKTVIKNIAKYAPVGDQFTEVAAIDETTPRIEDGIIDVESIVNAPPEPTRLGTAKAAMEAANGVTDDRREFEKPPAESELDPKSITAIKVLRDECFDKKLLTPAAFKKKLRAFGIGDPWEEKITGRQADMLELELSECVESGENEPEI